MSIRIRAAGVAGVLSAGLPGGATTMSSPGLAKLPAVDATNHALLTLYNETGDYETVRVTAHGANATTATIAPVSGTRPAAGWPVATKWRHGPAADDFPITVPNAAARLALPAYEGQLVTDLDTGHLYQREGNAWAMVRHGTDLEVIGATAHVGLSVAVLGPGVDVPSNPGGRRIDYVKRNGWINGHCLLIADGAVGSGNLVFRIPEAPAANGINMLIGQWWFHNTSGGMAMGFLRHPGGYSNTDTQAFAMGSGSHYSAAVAVADRFSWSFSYRAAS
jgi:hypothetical protein